MELDPNPKIFNPFDGSAEQYGIMPILYSKYILRQKPREGIELQGVPSDDEHFQKSHEYAQLPKIHPKLKDEKFPRFLFLGTGASHDYLLRNSSGILVHLT